MPKEKKTTNTRQSKATNTASPKLDPEQIAERKRNIRLSVGFFVTLIGAVCSISIISYCFNWKEDQNNLISNLSFWDFLFNEELKVENWSGRFGAAIAHSLVYRGVGVVSILFTLWIAAKGINILSASTYIKTKKWLRWMAFAVLFVSPMLSLIFAQHPFPFGGALGNAVVSWTYGFAGTAGTILVLLTVLAIFAFIVFKLDIKPLMTKAKSVGKEMVNEEEVSAAAQNDAYMPQSPTYGEIANRATHPDDEDVALVAPEFKPNILKEDTAPQPFDAENMDEEDEEAIGEMHLIELSMEEAEENPNTSIEEEIGIDIPDHLIITPFQSTEAQATEDAVANQGLGNQIPLELNATTTTPASSKADDLEILPPVQDNPASFGMHTDIAPATQKSSHTTVTGKLEPYDPSLELSRYKYPTLDLLDEYAQGDISFNREELERNKNQIIATLRSFGIEIQRISATVGPTVTLYEIVPAEGVRISKIRNLEDDIALSLSALGIRMIAPIPGKGTIGIEVPNANKQIVSMRALLESEKFINSTMSLPIALGKKIDNENYIVDLATMPHLLMAGATGQGKSVGINAILVSLLYKKHPSQVKFVMVDPKKVELSVYRLIEKHFLAKLPNEEEAIITDTKKVINTLNALCIEMDNRYELLKDAGARNIKEYNEKFIQRKLNPQDGHKFLPFIVLVIDEFADLIMTAGKEVEMPIARLAQLARAVGIHLIVATQRPSVNVITGIIKANFPARIAFRVSSKIDSRTILDTGGADQLIGRGDMLVSHGSDIIRLQCAFVDTPEVERIVEFIAGQQGYPTAFELPEYEGAENESLEEKNIDLSKRDKMFEDCAYLVVNSQSGSTSMLQRKFNLGYNRAGRIMDQLEAAGIVGPAHGSKPREVLVKTEYELREIIESLF